jgi:hypothetical protein
MARKTAKMSLEVDGPFAQAKKAASDFGFNMMYTQALDESLRLIDIAQREYDEAVEDGDERMMSQKRKELDYCLSCLKFSTVLVATESEELIT